MIIEKITYADETEMSKLAAMLGKEGIPFELKPFILGEELSIQIVSPSRKNRKIDAVCHWGSYGGETGLIEIMMELDDEEKEDEYDDGVRGYLTAEEAFEYFKKAV